MREKALGYWAGQWQQLERADKVDYSLWCLLFVSGFIAIAPITVAALITLAALF